MAVYIVCPQKEDSIFPFDFESVKFDTESRKRQVAEVIEANQESQAQRVLHSWLSDAERKGLVQILKDPLDVNVTGTSILDLSEEEVTRMEEEIPGIKIIPDQYIEIVEPYSVEPSSGRLSRIGPGVLEENRLWHLEAIGFNEPFRTQAHRLGQEVTVAVLDTGVEGNHPAFRGKTILSYINFSGEVVSERRSIDTWKHGTHVAGLICGNRIGVAQGASIMSCTVLPNRRGTVSGLIRALEWASQRPEVSIINISAGLDESRDGGSLKVIIDSVMQTGVLPICAAGNTGQGNLQSPAKYRDVISVGATDEQNRVATFSSNSLGRCDRLGYSIPSLVAPGDNVLSSVPEDDGYECMRGTSMAAAIVSGVAASMLGEEPRLTIDELKQRLISGCTLLADQVGQGAGIIQFKNIENENR